MSWKSILKTISGLLGGLGISVGVMFILAALLVTNLNSNLDSIDNIVSSGMQDFATNNKDDVRAFALQQLEQNPVMKEQFEKQMAQFTKENLAMPCSNPELIQDEESKMFLTESGVCDIVKDSSKTDDDLKNFMLDKMIEQNIDKFNNQEDLSTSTAPQNSGKEEIKKAIQDLQSKIGSPARTIILGVILIILGWGLTLVSVWFNWIRGFYRICLKTSINFLTSGVLFLLFHFLKTETFVNFIKNAGGLIKDANIQNMPDSLLNTIAKVLIEWLKLSTDPLIYISFIASAPFIIGTIVLFFYKRKLDKKTNEPEKIEDLDTTV
ncbi:hypothetical protein D6777_04490 [Candidatus Woesearchaeota archaeon]|nr:MAG: hypothetical protein D6777_04490 [Candidatus Woesearchaeota archaeon]